MKKNNSSDVDVSYRYHQMLLVINLKNAHALFKHRKESSNQLQIESLLFSIFDVDSMGQVDALINESQDEFGIQLKSL